MGLHKLRLNSIRTSIAKKAIQFERGEEDQGKKDLKQLAM